MAKGKAYHQRVHDYLIREGESDRAKIRDALSMTPKQLDSALTRLIGAKCVSYNGVYPYRTYYAATHKLVEDMRGRRSQATQFGRAVRPNWDAADKPLHPPISLEQCLASPSLHALERAWIAFLSTRDIAFRRA